jgi:hypothetical protein
MTDETTVGPPALKFISEDDLRTFEGWLEYQAIDLSALSAEDQQAWRDIYADVVAGRATRTKVGRMELSRPNVRTYAIADRDGDSLWLHMWLKRSPLEFFLFHPTVDGSHPHSSLHKDGRFHLKSHDRVMLVPHQKQPLSLLKGTEHLGSYGGFGPKAVGAVCDPTQFADVFVVPPGILGPRNGTVTIDLVEPGWGGAIHAHPGKELVRHVFEDVPEILVRIFR